MKKSKHKVFVVCAAALLLIIGCGPNGKTVKRLQLLEEGVSNPDTPEEIMAAIKKYGDRVEDIAQAQSQIGIWYKLLATRYLDGKMYGEALKTFQKAIEYYPTNANLYYYVGVCAGYMAKEALDYDATGTTVQKENYLKLSESAYTRAIEIEPRFVRALYALSVLYVFERGESDKAVPLLEKALSIETRHFDAMFVLARAYYSMGQYEKALAIYDKIIDAAPDTRKREAEINKTIVFEAYES